MRFSVALLALVAAATAAPLRFFNPGSGVEGAPASAPSGMPPNFPGPFSGSFPHPSGTGSFPHPSGTGSFPHPTGTRPFGGQGQPTGGPRRHGHHSGSLPFPSGTPGPAPSQAPPAGAN
ncbi:hypothetical protein BKA62DRAFT_683573 [Auriculariales sp. MPI-PUGE-AT-0066]|nr:hypothetical protein BKA62DRAFT_683573 [Auriculariales sp. MPI-PUGE-AT-0066]